MPDNAGKCTYKSLLHPQSNLARGEGAAIGNELCVCVLPVQQCICTPWVASGLGLMLLTGRLELSAKVSLHIFEVELEETQPGVSPLVRAVYLLCPPTYTSGKSAYLLAVFRAPVRLIG